MEKRHAPWGNQRGLRGSNMGESEGFDPMLKLHLQWIHVAGGAGTREKMKTGCNEGPGRGNSAPRKSLHPVKGVSV